MRGVVTDVEKEEHRYQVGTEVEIIRLVKDREYVPEVRMSKKEHGWLTRHSDGTFHAYNTQHIRLV